MDEAVRDGVDVISVSLGGSYPHLPEVSPDNALAIGSFHAVAHGIPVISAGGNGGPTTSSVEEVAPWLISVAASTVDRAFPTPITLGNNKTIMGRGLVIGTRVGFTGLVQDDLPKRWSCTDSSEALDDNGLFVYSDSMQHPGTRIPIVEVDFEAGNEILEYIEKSSEATVMIGPSSVLVGKPLTPKIAGFSSRGPNALAPEILKPDIAAPGASILAAVPPGFPANDNGFAFMSGTSMAAPHVGGIVALLRALHPHWSPAAIKSALVTTAWNEDSHKTPIFAEGSPAKIADPFDYGGGIVNPNAAAYPGLVYDMDREDYMNYLCSQDYHTADIYNATEETSAYNATAEQLVCQNRYISILDLNLPSIIIPALKTSITVKRRVTNVGPSNSVYRAKIKFPIDTTVSVKPDVLVFDSNTTTIDFEVTIEAEENMNTGYVFGSLTWTDGKHYVRIPICVRTTLYSLH
ncbi:Subtilisin-like protease SBT3.9 [Sesamum angolense]|uniref:Subtilisin-like protease SBT3.9 n=1 Tax=Sesamum angolense TaxID=2727404 RepID=A0AAE1WG34_9LAMI|nr:Subtilisin-like protease SBT3.9 [Sesamum angolense]